MHYQRSFTWGKIGISAGILCILCRLLYLQVYSSLSLLSRSKQNYLRYEEIVAPRGSIFDCKGTLLATNRPLVSLAWEGTGNRSLTDEQQKDLDAALTILQIEFPKHLTSAERQRRLYTIYEDLSFEQLSKLLEKFPQHANIKVITHFQRYYPHHDLVAHVLGHINTISRMQQGTMGLEKACNATLTGTPGQLLVSINSYGQKLHEQKIQPPFSGTDITTTIDIELQKRACTAFPEEFAGVFIVMEAETGALRAVVSQPSFDPNIFTKAIPEELWNVLLKERAFLNRAFSACYPAASLFKLVTAAAALETHVITPHETWMCNGYTIFHGRPYGCNRKTGHGIMTLDDALASSCNIPFYDIGRKIKINTLAFYAQLLGLGTPTGSIVGEKIGIIPSTQWKYETFGERWWLGETLSAAIGQSFILVTPIQICRMIGTICQGVSVIPYLLEGTTPTVTVPQISPLVLNRIRQAMRWTVTKGSGKSLADIDMKIYAKTGTAQTRNGLINVNNEREAEAHGWFVAHVTYKENPPLVLTILVEHSGTSRVALKAAKRFLRAYQKMIDLEGRA